MSDGWDISTGDGGISLYLPGDFSADLDARTGDGSIQNDLNVVSADTGGRENRRVVRGRARRRRQDASRPHRRRYDQAAKLLVSPEGRVSPRTALHAPSRVQRTGFVAYTVGSSTPASRNASRRSRHLLHRPQCSPSTGCMHESVRSNGTPSAALFDHVVLVEVRKRRVDLRSAVSSPSVSAVASARKNSGRRIGKRVAGERTDEHAAQSGAGT